MFNFKSIRTKLILFNILLVLLAAIIFIGVVINLDRKNLSAVRKDSEAIMKTSLRAEWEAKLRAMTILLSNKLIQPMHNFDISEMRHLVMTTIEKDINYIYVHHKNGRLLVVDIKGSETRGTELMGRVLDDELIRRAIAAKDVLVQEDGNIIDIASPIMLGPKKLGTVRIGFSTEGIQNTIEAMTKELDSGLDRAVLAAITNIFLAAVIAGIFILAIALFFANRLISPIYGLIDGTKKIAAGDLTYRIDVKSKDEIGRLADSFNRMTGEMQRYHTEKEKILKDMHDGIGGITTNIKLLSELAQNMTSLSEMKGALKTISELSQEGLTEIRNFMQSLDVREASWPALVAELRSFGSNMIESHGISFNMNASVEDIKEQPSSLLYLNIFRTYKEALTNIIKHSKAKSVDVDLSINTAGIILTIKDNGIGINEERKGNGRGISNMVMRAKELGGELTIITENGTCVTLKVHIPPKYPDMGMEI
ncbi:MAG: HAMP domain-containing protein [Nitrospirae bacterium]|nr:HAMP domain-containing protein [Nitrospirota bacterium]